MLYFTAAKWMALTLKELQSVNQQKPLFLPVIAYTVSTTKLEIRAK
jgi:hypothetical protein